MAIESEGGSPEGPSEELILGMLANVYGRRSVPVERRRAAGTLAPDFRLNAYQVLLDVEAGGSWSA